MSKNVIVLETDYRLGDIFEPILNDLYDVDERIFFTVTGFEIMSITKDGEVTDYLVKGQGQSSELVYFSKETIRKK